MKSKFQFVPMLAALLFVPSLALASDEPVTSGAAAAGSVSAPAALKPVSAVASAAAGALSKVTTIFGFILQSVKLIDDAQAAHDLTSDFNFGTLTSPNIKLINELAKQVNDACVVCNMTRAKMCQIAAALPYNTSVFAGNYSSKVSGSFREGLHNLTKAIPGAPNAYQVSIGDGYYTAGKTIKAQTLELSKLSGMVFRNKESAEMWCNIGLAQIKQ